MVYKRTNISGGPHLVLPLDNLTWPCNITRWIWCFTVFQRGDFFNIFHRKLFLAGRVFIAVGWVWSWRAWSLFRDPFLGLTTGEQCTVLFSTDFWFQEWEASGYLWISEWCCNALHDTSCVKWAQNHGLSHLQWLENVGVHPFKQRSTGDIVPLKLDAFHPFHHRGPPSYACWFIIGL